MQKIAKISTFGIIIMLTKKTKKALNSILRVLRAILRRF